MITLSENARKELEAYFADKERQTIRVYLAPGGCSGPGSSWLWTNPETRTPGSNRTASRSASTRNCCNR